MTASDIFERHLDLSPLRGRRRGQVRCPFHEDRRPSLSLDLDRGLFHCFGCGLSGGLRRFAELVGEHVDQTRFSHHPRGQPRSVLEEVLASALVRARRQPWAREGICELYAAADFIRRRYQAADRAGRLARTLGPGEQVWQALMLAAVVEGEALVVEAEVDAILAGRRTP